MSVGQYRGGSRPVTLPRQPMLNAKQIEAITLSIGALTGISSTVDDPALSNTLGQAATTLQAMLDNDAGAKAR